MRTLAISATLLLALTACGGDSDEEEKPTTTEAGETCDRYDDTETKTVLLEYDDTSIAMSANTAGIEGELDGLAAVSCIVTRLDGPKSLPDRVGATRALDGSQTEEWDGFEANWSFSGADDRLLFTVDAK